MCSYLKSDRHERSGFYGFLTGFMDMLPFIGTGIMLLPLGVIYFLPENTGKQLSASCCMDCAR